LESQITIVIEATSHENNRRGRRPLRAGQHEARDVFSRPPVRATTLKPVAAAEIPPENDQHGGLGSRNGRVSS